MVKIDVSEATLQDVERCLKSSFDGENSPLQVSPRTPAIVQVSGFDSPSACVTFGGFKALAKEVGFCWYVFCGEGAFMFYTLPPMGPTYYKV